MNAPAPGWHDDPTGRHQHRYWDGARWTDDVADAGTASVDPLGAGPAAGAGTRSGDPTSWMEPTHEDPAAGSGTGPDDPTAPIEPTHAYPTQSYPTPPGAPPPPPGPPPMAPGALGGPGQPWSTAPVPPSKRTGPKAGLIVGLAIVVVLVIGGIAYALASGDDDDTAEVADIDRTTTTLDDINTTLGDVLGDVPGDDTGGEGGGDVGGRSGDELIDMMADEIVRSSGGELTLEEARCLSEVMLDEFGLAELAELGESGENPFMALDAESMGRVMEQFIECAPEAMTGGGFGG